MKTIGTKSPLKCTSNSKLRLTTTDHTVKVHPPWPVQSDGRTEMRCRLSTNLVLHCPNKKKQFAIIGVITNIVIRQEIRGILHITFILEIYSQMAVI